VPVTAQYQATTTVRRPRVALLWTALAAYTAVLLAGIVAHVGYGFGNLMWWTLGPVIAAIQRRPKLEEASVVASADGLRVGDKLIPKAGLTSALLRSEHDRSYVCLRGGRMWGSVDVAVKDGEDADALCAALGLDAKSTTAVFTLVRNMPKTWPIAVALAFATAALGLVIGLMATLNARAFPAFALPLGFAAFIVVVVPLLVFLNRVKLHVGADGLLVREGLGRSVFVPHDAITRVRVDGRKVIVGRTHGDPMQFEVGAAQRSGKAAVVEEQTRQAESVAWRIDKAREAYRALAGAAPQAALVLERGGRSVREWLDALRRIGEGEGSTFRNATLTRDQLIGIVESTTAAARERLAAAVALRSKLTEEEKPRLRVAAERCVAPELRERMVRVIDTDADDEELTGLLEETERAAAS
jgi:hypothetical protein